MSPSRRGWYNIFELGRCPRFCCYFLPEMASRPPPPLSLFIFTLVCAGARGVYCWFVYSGPCVHWQYCISKTYFMTLDSASLFYRIPIRGKFFFANKQSFNNKEMAQKHKVDQACLYIAHSNILSERVTVNIGC